MIRRALSPKGAAVLFALNLCLVVLLTTSPFRFATDPATIAARAHAVEWEVLYFRPDGSVVIDADLILNLLFLMPLGAAWALAGREHSFVVTVLGALAVGAALSTTVECLQILLPSRTPQLADVLRNTLGCGVGAALGAVLRRKLRR